uniref:Uncharacterized protein n=1 Tax=Arundo donax TaxID=35708 RepID=A0A0A9R620_ARUDO
MEDSASLTRIEGTDSVKNPSALSTKTQWQTGRLHNPINHFPST